MENTILVKLRPDNERDRAIKARIEKILSGRWPPTISELVRRGLELSTAEYEKLVTDKSSNEK